MVNCRRRSSHSATANCPRNRSNMAFSVFLPQMGQNLGVAMGYESVPRALQFGALFDKIEKLPVEHREDALVFV